jgi:hypothetical protein
LGYIPGCAAVVKKRLLQDEFTFALFMSGLHRVLIRDILQRALVGFRQCEDGESQAL